MAEPSSVKLPRKLVELRVIDLKNELEKRGLDKNGIKQALFERLKTCLLEEGHDPLTYTFDTLSSNPSGRTKKTEQSLETETSCDGSDFGNQICIRFDEDFPDLVAKKKDDMDSVTSTSQATLDVCNDACHEKQEGEEEALNGEEEEKMETMESILAVKQEAAVVPEVAASTLQSESLAPDAKPFSISATITTTTATPASLTAATSTTPTTTAAVVTTTLEATTTLRQSHSDNNVISIDIAMDTASAHEHNDTPPGTPKEATSSTKTTTTTATTPAKMTASSTSSSGGGGNTTSQVAESSGKVIKQEVKSAVANGVPAPKAAAAAAASVVKTATGSHNLWVSGLSSTTRATDLKNLFSKHGKVTGAKVVTNAKSPGSKCYGFVTMASGDDCVRCIKHLHHTELHGKIISVEKAKAEPAVNKKAVSKATTTAATTAATTATSTTTTTAVAAKSTTTAAKSATEGGDKKAINTTNTAKDQVASTGSSREGGGGGAGEQGWRREGVRRIENRLGARFGREPFRYKQPYRRPVTTLGHFKGRRDANILTLDKIKEVRERERQREGERVMRQEERRQQMLLMREKERQKDVERMQREEAARLNREKEKLKLEKQKLEYDKIVAERERVSLEREKQRREREKLEKEREERKRELLKYQSENKGSRGKVAERKVPTYAFPSRPYGGYGKKESPAKKRSDSKGRHATSSRGETLKAGGRDDRSRVEWRAVSKNHISNSSSSSSSMLHRNSRAGNTSHQSNYPNQWPPADRSQTSSFGVALPAFNYLTIPPPPLPFSRPTTRYDPYRSSRR